MADYLRTELITRAEELAALAEDWDGLAEAQPQRLPMLSHAWVSTYFEHRLLPGETWACVAAFEGAKLVGVLPLVISRKVAPGFQRLRTPSDLQTVSVDFATAPGRAREIIPALLHALRSAFPRFRELNIQRIPEESPTLGALDHAGLAVTREFDGYGSYVRTEGDYEAFRKSVSGTVRKALRRGTSKLKRMSDVAMEISFGEEAQPEELVRLAEIEASSWKSRTGSSIKGDPDLLAFYKTLVKRLADAGWLEWCFLTGDGKTLAGQMSIRMAGSLVVWKVGYDEAYRKASPGSVLLEQRIKAAFESDQIDEVNWMTYYGWHEPWRASRRSYYNVYVSPRRPLPLLFFVWPRQILNLLRRVPGARATARRIKSLLGKETVS